MEILQTVWQALVTGVTFLLVITVLVFVHELGHFWVAKAFGMHVDSFAVMMGGVRKSDLRDRLKGKLVDSWMLWLIGGITTLAALGGALLEIELLFVIGMAMLVVGWPAWVISRLCALYHMPLGTGIRILVSCWAVVALILALGTQFRGVEVGYVLSMFLAGSVVGVLLTYYQPVLKKSEESKMGEGLIVVEGVDVPVRFRPVWCTKSKGGTEFSLLLLPLGGFAAIKGMHPKEDGSEVKIERGFYSKAPWKRFLVLFAGPLFSIWLGQALVFASFVNYGDLDPIPVVREFSEDSVSEKAGLEKGDKIVSINGNEIDTWFNLVDNVRFSYELQDGYYVPKPVTVGFERDGAVMSAVVTPRLGSQPEVVYDKDDNATGEKRILAYIGIRPDSKNVPLTTDEAIQRSLRAPLNIVTGLVTTFSSVENAKNNVGGPGAMVQATGQAVELGIWGVVSMAGSLSLVLGIINLFPVPPLDGGQMVVAFAEMLRGNRRLSPSLQGMLSTIGMIFVILIMLLPLVVDANRAADGGTDSGPETSDGRVKVLPEWESDKKVEPESVDLEK